MKKQIQNAIALLKETKINGCITGSIMLDYFEGQDIDIFVYSEADLIRLLSFCTYNNMFIMNDSAEIAKLEAWNDGDRLGLDKLGLVSFKFVYNTCIDVNIVYRKFTKTIYDVISNFDLDIIAQGYDIKTGQVLSLRTTEGFDCDWNRYNRKYSSVNEWTVKRFLRQFDRCIKYHNRGYNTDKVVLKFIEMIEKNIQKESRFKTDKGKAYQELMCKELTMAKEILQIWLDNHQITEEELYYLKGYVQDAGTLISKNEE